jgi:hypothetical protein
MSKGWGRAAFSFTGKAASLFRYGGKATSKMNVILLAVDTAISLVNAGCSYMRYRYAKQNTAELAEQVSLSKNYLDTLGKEEEKRASIEIKERQKMMLLRLQEQEQMLRQKQEMIRLQFEQVLSRHGFAHEQVLREIDLQKQVREPIKQAMDLFSELLEMARDKGEHFSIISELEEQYRICATEYEKIIQHVW